MNNDAGFPAYSAIKVISIPSSEAEIDALRSEGVTIEQSKEYFKDIANDFVNEIKLMLTLKGAPNIVAVDTFKIAEKTDAIGWDIFIRMELLRSFKDYLDEHTPTEKEVIKIGTDIANALEICQQKHIIHRDIKPANIFIDDFGSFKLGDFGIAKELEKTTGAVSSKGTFSYMAPEVAHGQRYDSTVDIYSLGLVMYSLLNNNKPPFVNPHSTTLSFNERREANDRRLAGKPIPPPCNASPMLADIILTACSHDPDKRFKSATAFKNALKSCSAASTFSPAVTPTAQKNEIDIDSTIAANKPPELSIPYTPTVANQQISQNSKPTVPPSRSKSTSTSLNRINPSVDAKLFAVIAPLFILPLNLFFYSIVEEAYAQALSLGITSGIFACITFFFPMKYAGIFFILHEATFIGAYLLGIPNSTWAIFILPLIFLLASDSFKKKKATSPLRTKILASVASVSNHLIILMISTVTWIVDGKEYAADFLNTIYELPVAVIMPVSVIAAISATTIMYNLTVAKHKK